MLSCSPALLPLYSHALTTPLFHGALLSDAAYAPVECVRIIRILMTLVYYASNHTEGALTMLPIIWDGRCSDYASNHMGGALTMLLAIWEGALVMLLMIWGGALLMLRLMWGVP